MKRPNWKEWNLTPEARIWEACALSLNIDPHSMKHSGHGWMSGGSGPYFERGSFPDTAHEDEFKLRMRVLAANAFDSNYFSPASQSNSGANYCSVRLPEFAVWAVSVAEWENLPPELVALARKSDPTPSAPATAPTPVAKPSESEAKPLENWKMRVQAEATKRYRDQRKLGCNPNPHSLKDELADWCRDNNIFTKGNINPNPDYLYRHVLSSKHWTPPKDD